MRVVKKLSETHDMFLKLTDIKVCIYNHFIPIYIYVYAVAGKSILI